MRKRGGKAPNQGKASPHFPPWCRCAAAREPTPRSHSSPAVLCHPSPVSLVTTEPPRRNHTLQRNKDCCSPLTPPPLHHFWIIKSGTAIARLESSSIIMATQMFTVHLLSECQDTRDLLCQMDTEVPLPWGAYHSTRNNSYGKSKMQWMRWGSNVRGSQSSAVMLAHEHPRHKPSELLLLSLGYLLCTPLPSQLEKEFSLYHHFRQNAVPWL